MRLSRSLAAVAPSGAVLEMQQRQCQISHRPRCVQGRPRHHPRTGSVALSQTFMPGLHPSGPGLSGPIWASSVHQHRRPSNAYLHRLPASGHHALGQPLQRYRAPHARLGSGRQCVLTPDAPPVALHLVTTHRSSPDGTMAGPCLLRAICRQPHSVSRSSSSHSWQVLPRRQRCHSGPLAVTPAQH